MVVIMAKYHGTFSCGHEGWVNVTGPQKFRAGRIEYKFGHNVCPECYEKQKKEWEEKNKEKAKEIIEKNKEEGFPELIGTEKQINWSVSIREQKINEMRKKIEENIHIQDSNGQMLQGIKEKKDKQYYIYKHNQIEGDKNLFEEMLPVVLSLQTYRKSTYWIDNRDSLGFNDMLVQILYRCREFALSEEELAEYTINPFTLEEQEGEQETVFLYLYKNDYYFDIEFSGFDRENPPKIVKDLLKQFHASNKFVSVVGWKTNGNFSISVGRYDYDVETYKYVIFILKSLLKNNISIICFSKEQKQAIEKILEEEVAEVEIEKAKSLLQLKTMDINIFNELKNIGGATIENEMPYYRVFVPIEKIDDIEMILKSYKCNYTKEAIRKIEKYKNKREENKEENKIKEQQEQSLDNLRSGIDSTKPGMIKISFLTKDKYKDGLPTKDKYKTGVFISYKRDETFIRIAKKYGFKYNGENQTWEQNLSSKYSVFSSNELEDIVWKHSVPLTVLLARELLEEGYMVEFPSKELKELAEGKEEVVSEELPTKYIYFLERTSQFIIKWEGFDRSLFTKAKKLPTAEWEDGKMRVSGEEYKKINSFAKRNEFFLTESATNFIKEKQSEERKRKREEKKNQ